MVHLYHTMKSFLVLILEIRLAFPPQVKSIVPPFTDSLRVSLGIIKTILYARSLSSGLGQSLPFNCGCSSLKEQWGEEGKFCKQPDFPCCRCTSPLSGNLNFQGLTNSLSIGPALLLLCFLLRLQNPSPPLRVTERTPTRNPHHSLCLCSVFPAPRAREWGLCLPPSALQRPPELGQCHRVPVC